VSTEVPGSVDLSLSGLSREARLKLGQRVVVAFGALVRHVRSPDGQEEGPGWKVPLQALAEGLNELLAEEGRFELSADRGVVAINREPVRLDVGTRQLAELAERALHQRGLGGFRARLAPPRDELIELVRLFGPGGFEQPDERGDPARPLKILELLPRGADRAQVPEEELPERLVQAYAHAALYVDRTIVLLRSGGQSLPVRYASRIIADLVDLQLQAPRAFLQLSRCKPPQGDFWGQHAANVALLAITFGARLGLARARRHDLGMAALLHDVGVAALPPALLDKNERLTEREMTAVKQSPLFAARAVLRDREVHASALERAMAACECHLDLVPSPGEPLPEVGLTGRVIALCEAWDALASDRPHRPARSPEEALQLMRTELVFRFDPLLLSLFPAVVFGPAATARAG
jgi:hypothetical protein